MKSSKITMILLVLSVVVFLVGLVSWQPLGRRKLADNTFPSGEHILIYYRYHPNFFMALSGVGGLEYEWRDVAGRKRVFPLTSEGDFDIPDDVALHSQILDHRSVYVTCSRGQWILTKTGKVPPISESNAVPVEPHP